MRQNLLFPFSIGVSDGIITALILASGGIVSMGITPFLALKISFGSAFAGMFSFFIADYAGLNEELHRTARQLNLRSTRYLLRGRLGRDILLEAFIGTLISSFFGFTGALIPLMSSMLVPHNIYIPLLISYAALGLVGYFISRTTAGSWRFWIFIMIAIGIIVTIAGSYLKLIS
ncbi:hypothetical protein [Picrophilus oshimae]|uniref:Hypothetical membrane protein n=1 Tax=Picrophilus torridus (strain ATCC 700027 / DSM 9790 / JCM 10055 / NBRC 100828 / KAW 2/3) TaxID=1122961 RepID=Q6L0A2_PICTO|nr:hypothetical protein [Picrophilus oshimae]AAT43600.1 hypothetical membrane protein [Picrophilus oshimae DSM 9789]SMD31227.1 hypothetical protein SAMN02745355_1151 [Picrophilus oshimae DSM 9789]